MAAVLSIFHLFMSLLLVTETCSGSGHRKLTNHATLFIFGDSLFDAGNNQYLPAGGNQSNVWPYGETFFHHATGRVCNGRIPPDFIAEYADLPLIKPYLEPGFDNYAYGVNFASAGAGVLRETSPNLLYLKLQISYFQEVAKKLTKQLGDAAAKMLISESVYLFSMGGNDYLNLTMNSTQKVPSKLANEYITMVLGNYTDAIKTIYGMGGRKLAFQNVGPLGCMPATKAEQLAAISGSSGHATIPDCIEAPQILAKKHNVALAKLLKDLSRKLPGFKYVLFDYFSTLGQRTLHSERYDAGKKSTATYAYRANATVGKTYPNSFFYLYQQIHFAGFEVGKSACCGSGAYNGNFTCGSMNGTVPKYHLCRDPSQYVWFDPGHPTERTNKQLSDIMWDGHPDYVIGNLRSFFKTKFNL